MANLIYHGLQPGLEEAYFGGGAGLSAMGVPLGTPSHDESAALYAASELNDPEYSTDDFRMFSFKVARCSKRYVHDWRSCPFAHPTENARRRDPRTVRYLPVPCPDYKRGICMRGDACPYSHGVYECWLHPAKYRTQLCKEGPSCRRPVCFFAHSVADLRQPTYLWNGGEEAAGAGSASAAAALLRQAAPMPASAGGGEAQIAAEEAFNNMQEAGIDSAPPAIAPQGSAESAAVTPRSVGAAPAAAPAPGSGEASPTAAAAALHQQEQQLQLAAMASGSLSDVDAAAVAAVAPSPTKAAAEASSPLSPDASAAMAAAASAAASRLSADSAMQVRAATAAATNGQPDWSQSLAASATAAAALAGVPVNEQPMLPNHGPRMSNAVARKLGLAPTKPPAATAAAAAVAAAAAARGAVAIPAAGAAGAYPRGSMDDIRLTQALSGLGGRGALGGAVGAMPFPYGAPEAAAAPYASTYPGADTLGIHPALLNLVAANMGGGGGVDAAAMQAHHQAAHQAQLFAFGGPGHMGHAPRGGGGGPRGVASLLGHMSQWGLNDGSGSSEDSSVHSSTKGTASFPHRGSSEGMLGATAMPQAPGAPGQQSFAMLGLDMDANNRAGVPSEC